MTQGPRIVKIAVIVFVLAAAIGGCTRQSDLPPADKPADMHNSRNSLDWTGVYEGVLPCADCPGIQTRLVLSAEDSFVLSTQYLDRQATPQVVRGQFNWNAAGSAIALDAAGDGQQFMVGEGRLLQLNRDGTPTAPGAQNRVLMKVIAK